MDLTEAHSASVLQAEMTLYNIFYCDFESFLQRSKQSLTLFPLKTVLG